MPLLLWILAILALLIIVFTAFQGNPPVNSVPKALNQINVVVVTKTAQHPFFHQGSDLGFSINGVQGAPLNLKRGVPYLFNINNVQHPLYFTMSAVGDNNGVDRIPGSPNPFVSPTTVIFGDQYPNNFYYQCAIHQRMGGPISLV